MGIGVRRLSRAALLAAASVSVALTWVHGAEAKYRGLQAIRWANPYCESGGNPYVTTNPTYRGKWQFDQWTWNRFAPSWLDGRDPASVSEYWQDRVALRVTYDAWPNC